MTDWVKIAMDGEIVCDIGQLSKPDLAALDRAVKKNDLIKWRGYYWPVKGALHGIGPLKTCFARKPLP